MAKALSERGRLTSSGGFSLLELTTALFILVVGLFGVFQLFHFGLDRMRTLDEAAIAVQAVQNELEVLRTTPFSSLQDGERAFAVADPALERLVRAETRVAISPAPDGIAGLKKIDVSIRWITENGRQAERSVTTLLGEKLP